MYYYILGFGIACLILAGISSMDTVYIKPAQIVIKALFTGRGCTRHRSSFLRSASFPCRTVML